MKLNLSGLHGGVIGLENKVIDLSKREIRPKVTEQELEIYYEECIRKFSTYSEYFEDQKAFKKTINDSLNNKPRLLAREPKYPGLFSFWYWLSPRDEFWQESKKLREKYFFAGRYSFAEKRIEIPNDRTKGETKATTYHETLHHIILGYCFESNRLITKDDADYSKIKRNVAEFWTHEGLVNYFTDLLLEDDKEALFYERWLSYKLKNQHIFFLSITPAALATGFLLGEGISNPELLPLTIVPYIISSYVYDKYKNSKKEKLTEKVERTKFKI